MHMPTWLAKMDSSIWIMLAVAVPIAGLCAYLTIRYDPTCAASFLRWRQKRALLRIRSKLPALMLKLHRDLWKAWDANPTAQCAKLFKRFVNPSQQVSSEQLSQDVNAAIIKARSLFDTDFLAKYAQMYRNALVVETSQVARLLASQQPDNSDFIYNKLAQDDTRLLQSFEVEICSALEEGRTYCVIINAHLQQLRDNFARFHKILNPGFLVKCASIIVGALTGVALGAIGINSDLLISKAAQFTATKWSNWKGDNDKEFGDKYVAAIYELPEVCESMDAAVRQELHDVLGRYIQHQQRHREAILNVLLELSEAGWDVGTSIAYLKTFNLNHSHPIAVE